MTQVLMPTDLCLCGSKQPYSNCCQPFHLNQAEAPSAEKLMRSRFVAYALHLDDYLAKTWSKTTRPGDFSFENDLIWTRLRIVKTQKGHAEDETGTVTFKAFYEVDGQKGLMTEKSRFVREEGRWVYLDDTE